MWRILLSVWEADTLETVHRIAHELAFQGLVAALSRRAGARAGQRRRAKGAPAAAGEPPAEQPRCSTGAAEAWSIAVAGASQRKKQPKRSEVM